MKNERPNVLKGSTYWIKTQDGTGVGVTINEKDGTPFEVMFHCDDPDLYQWVALSSTFSTRLLRCGQPLEKLAAEMEEIHCPATRHIIPGTNEWSPGLISRIGRTLRIHMESKKNENTDK